MENYKLIREMIRWEENVPGRIQHFLKVHAFAKQIGEGEKLPERTMEILETAAIVHDIGIRPAMAKYNDAAGPYQEKEGAPAAKKLLTALGYDEELTERVSVLVGRHHTYENIDGPDCQILIEADFLVNLYEGEADREKILNVRKNIFRTAAGTEILNTMFGLE